MFDVLGMARKGRNVLMALGLASAVAACDATNPTVSGGGEALSGNGAVNVALLVPYGSPTPGDEGLARSLENAARLAAADLGGSINLKVYRTAGQAGTAAAVTDQAIAEGAQIIVGPLRSDAANASAVAARDDGVNVLAFSNNTSIAGGNLFVLGNTFDNIATRMMRYASSQGRSRLVIVSPQTPVGQIAKNSITRAASGANVQIVGDGSFEFSQEGIASAAPAISSTVQATGATAIMLTDDSAGALPLLAELLPTAGIDPATVKYMGLTRWDVPPQTLTLQGLEGGWFALPDPSLTARFNARYQGTYGNPPHPLAGLAYDGVAAVGALAAKNLKATAGNLTQSSGFVGVNGVFRLKSNGTVERALAIAQVTNSQVQIIDAAPKSFSRGGS